MKPNPLIVAAAGFALMAWYITEVLFLSLMLAASITVILAYAGFGQVALLMLPIAIAISSAELAVTLVTEKYYGPLYGIFVIPILVTSIAIHGTVQSDNLRRLIAIVRERMHTAPTFLIHYF